MAVIQYRLDGRMLHGQVSNFARALNIEEFVVINEKTANDPTQVCLLYTSSTAGRYPSNPLEAFQ